MTDDEMVSWHYQLNEHESEQTPGDNEGQVPGMLQSMGSQRSRQSFTTEKQQEIPETKWNPLLHCR